MTKSIVSIESLDENNKSFGTGFIIDTDEKGVYILTCKHVIDDVKTPMVEEVKARIIAMNDFIDMAVIYVSKLQNSTLPLQIDSCERLDVEVIGFSHFNKNLKQKKHIQATLYQESIELHSNKDDSFYIARKIKANDGYNFDRGNSGSPVICKQSLEVIAMVSNKEGNDIGYAINISSLQEIWKEMPKKLLDKKKIDTFILSQINETPRKIEETIETEQIPTNNISENYIPIETKTKKSILNKYSMYLFASLIFAVGSYLYLSKKHRPAPQHSLMTQKKPYPMSQKPMNNNLNQAKKLEQEAFEALIARDFNKALQNFEEAEEKYHGFHTVYEIARLLRKNQDSFNRPKTQIHIIRTILSHPEASPRILLKRLKESFRIKRVQ